MFIKYNLKVLYTRHVCAQQNLVKIEVKLFTEITLVEHTAIRTIFNFIFV
jgi:hypothetical protein